MKTFKQEKALVKRADERYVKNKKETKNIKCYSENIAGEHIKTTILLAFVSLAVPA